MTKTIRKAVFTVLTMLISISAFSINVFAGTWNAGGTGSYLTNNGYTVTVPFIKNTVTGQKGLCLTFDKIFPAMSEYEDAGNPYNDSNMRGILYYWLIDTGLQQKYGLSDEEADYGAGIAAWRWAYEHDFPGNETQSGFYNLSGNQRIIDFINELKSKTLSDIKDFSLNFDGNISLGKDQVTSSITLSEKLNYSVIVNSGATVLDNNGNPKTNFSAGEAFRVSVPGSFKGELKVTVKTVQKDYGALLFNAKNNRNQTLLGFGQNDPVQHNKDLNLIFTGSLVDLELTKLITEADGTLVDPQPNLKGKITFELWKKIGNVPNANRNSLLKSNLGNEPDNTRIVLDDGNIIEYVETQTLDSNNKAQFNDLFAFDDNGNDIIYYWHELDVLDKYNKIPGYNALPPLGEFAGTTYITEIENTIARYPELHTTATTPEGGKEVPYNQDVTIVDTVEYVDLQPNKEYTLEGVIMDKSTGQPLIDHEGNEIRTEVVFTPAESNGTIDVTFSFNTTGMAGKEVVVFEYLKSDDNSVIDHTDIDDDGQTIKVKNEPVPDLPITGDYTTDAVMIGGALMGIALVIGIIILNRKKKVGNE